MLNMKEVPYWKVRKRSCLICFNVLHIVLLLQFNIELESGNK